MIDSHIVFPAFCYSALSIATDRSSTCIAEKKTKSLFRDLLQITVILLFFKVPFSHTKHISELQIRSFWYCSHLKVCRISTLILFKIIYVNLQQENRLTGTELYATLTKSESFKVVGKEYHHFARAKTTSNKTR